MLAGEDRAPVVQWRFKGLADHQALAGARELAAATRKAGALLFINDRPDIARIVAADGVHVGQEDLDPADVRAVMPEALIGVSTHSQDQFARALDSPVDCIAVGPVFGTVSKTNPDPVVGVPFVSWASKETRLPVIAIGGLNVGNSAEAVRAGARGIAVISELMRSEHPGKAVRRLCDEVRRAAASGSPGV